MKNKARINYWVDIVIALAFVVAAVTGLVLYLGPESGYQGGRNPHYGQEILFMDQHVWKDLHTWGSIAMTAGVLAHLVLHWNWMVCMTRNLVRRTRDRVAARQCEIQETDITSSSPALQTR